MTGACRLHQLQIVDDHKAQVGDTAALGVHVGDGERGVIVNADVALAQGLGGVGNVPPLLVAELTGEQGVVGDKRGP